MEKQNLMVCVPGQRLSKRNENYSSGYGTYERQGYIHAMLAGFVEIQEKDNTKVIEVHSLALQTIVPVQGDVVTAEITHITSQFCKCLIKVIGDQILNRPLRSVLKKEEIRATEKDRTDVRKSYRPGDIILARVLPITEAQNYQLTTAEKELGVVFAHSEAGYPMVPLSWSTMQCTKTYLEEPRKVARIVPESLQDGLSVNPR